jgi:hypothetical protein
MQEGGRLGMWRSATTLQTNGRKTTPEPGPRMRVGHWNIRIPDTALTRLRFTLMVYSNRRNSVRTNPDSPNRIERYTSIAA